MLWMRMPKRCAFWAPMMVVGYAIFKRTTIGKVPDRKVDGQPRHYQLQTIGEYLDVHMALRK